MVRLKQYLNEIMDINIDSLNSTMVRLKPKYNWFQNKNSFGSQFHYGSIKTSIRRLYIKPSISLNSTMVRLKQEKFKYAG